MVKVINDSRVEFWDEELNEMVMYIDYPADECIWYFNSDNEITVTEDMELFNPLKSIMHQNYKFSDDDILKSYKEGNKLVWYSDCYYNPDDEWSVKYVSYLTIVDNGNEMILKCRKPLDEVLDRRIKTHVIAFSPLGNGKYVKNAKTGLTLQDDFVICVYQELLKINKVKKLKI